MNAIVTGATKGIGLSIVKHLAANNYNLALCARNAEDLVNLKQKLTTEYPNITVIYKSTDLADASAVKDFARFVREHFNSIDVLINNAGLFIPSKLFDEHEDALEKQMQLNLYTPHLLSKIFGGLMKEAGKGHIFNICSVASLQPVPGAASYSISKIALLGLTRVLREELLPDGVKVTAIIPGSTLTASWEGTDVPPGHFIDPDDIAGAVIQCLNTSLGANIDELIIRPMRGNL